MLQVSAQRWPRADWQVTLVKLSTSTCLCACGSSEMGSGGEEGLSRGTLAVGGADEVGSDDRSQAGLLPRVGPCTPGSMCLLSNHHHTHPTSRHYRHSCFTRSSEIHTRVKNVHSNVPRFLEIMLFLRSCICSSISLRTS